MFINTDSKFIWMNGEFLKWDETKVHALTHTLHYGVGVFEGVRAYKNDLGGAIFRLDDHTRRLFDAASKVNINIPYSIEDFNQIQKDTLKQNKLEEAYIRPIVFFGSEELGLRASDLSVNVAVACWEWPSYMDPEKKKNGISIVTSPYKQYENPLYSNNKIVGTYVNSIMALHDALARGSDEALLMDIKGNISEGSGENLFIVKNGDIFTPTTENCLNGITRQSIIKIASDLNLKVKELNLQYEDLLDADEAFFTGTAVEVTPISKVDDRIIGSGKIGSTTQKLQSIFEDIVSAKNNQYKDWLYQI